jgi:hypothetical protein
MFDGPQLRAVRSLEDRVMQDATDSRRLAGWIGPTLLALGLTEAWNMDIYATQTAPVVYLNGTLLFVVGLAIVRAHPHWTWRWPVLVTLTGWGALLVGLYRMAAPDAPQAGESLPTFSALMVLTLIGAVLTWAAYAPRGAPSDGREAPHGPN